MIVLEITLIDSFELETSFSIYKGARNGHCHPKNDLRPKEIMRPGVPYEPTKWDINRCQSPYAPYKFTIYSPG